MQQKSELNRRTTLAALAGAVGWAGFGLSRKANAQSTPIRIGGTLALTGPLSATGLVHKLVSDIAIEDLKMTNPSQT